MPDRRLLARAAEAALVVAAILLVHHRVYTIPFLYSEVGGLGHNPVVLDLNAFRERMLTPRGLVERPLSVLTYALNHRFGGLAGYHAVNVAIHAANALLVLAIARRAFAAPLFAALVFALHPLATACTSQIFGRNYSLASTFAFLALLVWIDGRRRGALGAGRAAAVTALLVLAALTKQTLVAFPLVLVWWEVGLGPGWRAGRGTWVALAAWGALVAGLAVAYALPLARTATIPPVAFALTQLAHAPTIARFYLLPYQTALVHDLPLYRDPLAPAVLLGAALVALVVWTAWRRRSQPAGWLLGALVLCLLPTNSIFPKNEIVREWRLYPGLFFFALLAGEAAAGAVRRLGARPAGRRLVPAVWLAAAVWLASFAHTDLLQNDVYQTRLDAWRQVLDRYPESADAMNNVAVQYFARGKVEMARRYLTIATRTAPDVALYRENLAEAYRALGDMDEARAQAARAARIRRRVGRRTMKLRWAED
jgi:hypothetical protein